MKKIFLIFLSVLGTFSMLNAKELNCTVTINSEQIQLNGQIGASQIYGEIKNVMQEFMNGRRWSNDNFSQEEKINCSLTIILTKASNQGDYEANCRFQVLRPVYGTTYETVLLNYIDRNFNFKYVTGTPLNYNDNSFSDNLTSLMAYYAYIALAVDYDSFGKMGGTQFVQKAFNVSNLAQWIGGTDVRNRYWLAENLMNQQLQPLREGFYSYYRLAMDTYANNPEEGRKQIMTYLETIRQVNQVRPGTLLVRIFFDGKSEELVNIFSDANPTDRKKVATLLASLDPNHSDAYRKLGK
jgi:hypothetical protein